MVLVRAVQAGTGKWVEFRATEDEPLLDQLEEHCPFPAPFLCSMGACGSCSVRVRQGRDLIDDAAFDIGCSAESSQANILPCVAGLKPQAIRAEGVHRVVVDVRHPAASLSSTQP